MSHDFKRTDRVSETILRKLALIMQQEMIDPGLPKFITLSAAKITKDLGHAKIYFTVFNADPAEVATRLNAAAGHFRTLLAKTITFRTVPELHFIYDESIEYGHRLSKLIDKANPSSEHDSGDE